MLKKFFHDLAPLLVSSTQTNHERRRNHQVDSAALFQVLVATQM